VREYGTSAHKIQCRITTVKLTVTPALHRATDKAKLCKANAILLSIYNAVTI